MILSIYLAQSIGLVQSNRCLTRQLARFTSNRACELHPQESPSVHEETHRVACAAFPKGTLCLGPIDHDGQFVTLFLRRGQPAEAPGRLALATVLQYVEGLSDRQAADAVRAASDAA